MAKVLLEEVNPNGNIQAVFEADDDVCYFYLFGAPDSEFRMKSVWVRNLKPAPKDLDVVGMRDGLPPMNPARHCRHPLGLAVPNSDDLAVVWLPEGNGAALYEDEEILAIIPPWSGIQGFDGFARDSIGEGPLAWELGSDNVLHERFEQAQEYWGLWEDEDFWPSVQSSLISQVEQTFGPHAKYYAIDGGDWPPKAMLRIPWQDRVVLITIGVSARPQPNVEMQTETPELLRRIELGAVLPAHWPEAAIQGFGQYISGQTNLPWDGYTWIGKGHTLPCDYWKNPDYRFALLLAEHAGAPLLSLDSLLDDPVNVLWFVPITEAERQVAIDNGSESLVQRFPTDRWQDA